HAALDKEMAERKQKLDDEKEAIKARIKEQEFGLPKGSKVKSGASAHSPQQTAASSTPQKSTKNGQKK
ncbi:MAG: hypothetical protein M3036_04550, partial [Bifidobacteriales bacterium]|nr:hypothetical protein [Bifidobacteriales bacterium]